MALTDPLKCNKCGYIDPDKLEYLAECPACGSEDIAYPIPSDGELIDRLIIPERERFHWEPVQDGKDTRDGKGSLLLPGDDVRLYGQVAARIFRVLMPQGWLIVRLVTDDPIGLPGITIFSDMQYQISAALVFAINPRVEKRPEVNRISIDAPGWGAWTRRLARRIWHRWVGL